MTKLLFRVARLAVAFAALGCGGVGSVASTDSTMTGAGGQYTTNPTGGTGGTGGIPSSCKGVFWNKVFGEMEGKHIDEYWNGPGFRSISADPYWLNVLFNDRGQAFFRSTLPGDPFDLAFGTYPLDFAVAEAPPSTTFAGSVICLGGATAVVSADTPEGTTEFHVPKAALLGTCPGAPVSGEVLLCNNCADKPAVSGEIEGIPVGDDGYSPWDFPGYGGDPPLAHLFRKTNQLLLRAFTKGTQGPESSGDIDTGLIFTLPESPFASAVYCIGPGSTWEWSGGFVSATLKNLSKLGTCNGMDSSGSMLMCL